MIKYGSRGTRKFEIGDDDTEQQQIARHAYEQQYLFSECRKVGELVPLWKQCKKFHKLKFEAWIAERNNCRKDVYHLGLVLGHDFVPHVHVEMCSFFVQKNFDGVYQDAYTMRDVNKAIEKHHMVREFEMLMLCPRGSFKSTANQCDCVSWLLNAPDTQIMIVSGEYKLAEKFMTNIKKYFHRPEDADPTPFQALFPEYVMDDKEAQTMTPLHCAARIIPNAEPSLWVNSIGSSLSGWHASILKGDDTTTDENANTEGTREKLNEKWTGALNLVNEWGFVDSVGTRYFIDDQYGERLKLQHELPLKFLRRQAWTVKEEFKDVKEEDLREHMVDLYFPEKLDFKSLRAKLLRNRTQWACQQQNLPAGDDDNLIHFGEDELRAAHEQIAAVPFMNAAGARQDIYVAIDTSTGATYGDYSAIAACVFEKMPDNQYTMHVVDVAFGKWKPSVLSRQIVEFCAKWSPRVALIEDWAGSELVKREISTLAQAASVLIPLYWHKKAPEYNAKRARIEGVEILLAAGRVKFVNGAWTDELLKQFCRYTGERVRQRHDDICDAIGYVAQKFLPNSTSDVLDVLRKAEQERRQTVQYKAHIFRTPPVQHPPEASSGNSIDDQFFGGQGIYRG